MLNHFIENDLHIKEELRKAERERKKRDKKDRRAKRRNRKS